MLYRRIDTRFLLERCAERLLELRRVAAPLLNNVAWFRALCWGEVDTERRSPARALAGSAAVILLGGE